MVAADVSCVLPAPLLWMVESQTIQVVPLILLCSCDSLLVRCAVSRCEPCVVFGGETRKAMCMQRPCVGTGTSMSRKSRAGTKNVRRAASRRTVIVYLFWEENKDCRGKVEGGRG